MVVESEENSAKPRRPQRSDRGNEGEEGHQTDPVVRRDHGIGGEDASCDKPEAGWCRRPSVP